MMGLILILRIVAIIVSEDFYVATSCMYYTLRVGSSYIYSEARPAWLSNW